MSSTNPPKSVEGIALGKVKAFALLKTDVQNHPFMAKIAFFVSCLFVKVP